MRRLLIILLGGAMCTPVMGQVIMDPVPPTPFTLFCSGTLPAPVTVRIELLTTAPGGGAPVASSVFDTAVPAGLAVAWCTPLLTAIAADPLVAGGAIASGPFPNMFNMPINSAAGIRLAIRAISTTAPPLPALPTMPPLAAAATPWPAAPAQLGAAAASANFAAVALGPPPTPVGILGAHFLAIPPFLRAEALADPPTLAMELPAPATPTVSAWGLVAMTLLVLAAGTVVLYRRRVRQVQ